MDLHLQDKSVIVTGGAKGIGGAAVESFAAEGAKVLCADIVRADAEAVAAGLAIAAEAGAGAAGRKLSMLKMLYVAKDEADRREKVAIAHANH